MDAYRDFVTMKCLKLQYDHNICRNIEVVVNKVCHENVCAGQIKVNIYRLVGKYTEFNIF